MKKLDFLYFDAGGGHRSAANALLQVITDQQRPWEVRMVNLQEVLDPLDVFRKLTGPAPAGSLQPDAQERLDARLAAAHCGHAPGDPALYRPAQVRLLEKFWRERRPDMVVSLVPNFNLALGRACARRCPACRW